MPGHVAENHRRGVEPREDPQRVEVRHHVEVAVAAGPVGHLVAGDRVHLHVDRHQVVASLGRLAVVGGLDEVFGIDALAHESALHIGEGDDNGVDRAFGDLVSEVLLGQHSISPFLVGLARHSVSPIVVGLARHAVANVGFCGLERGPRSARRASGPRAGRSSAPPDDTAPQR